MQNEPEGQWWGGDWKGNILTFMFSDTPLHPPLS